MNEKQVVHKIKCWREPYRALREGRKRFEFRKDDRGYEVGHELFIEEFDEAAGEKCGPWSRFIVTYIARGPAFGIPLGHVVMSLMPVCVRGD